MEVNISAGSWPATARSIMKEAGPRPHRLKADDRSGIPTGAGKLPTAVGSAAIPTGALQFFSFYDFWVSPNDDTPGSGYGWNWHEISSWMNLPTVDPIALESDYWLAQWRQGIHSYIMCANRCPSAWTRATDNTLRVDGARLSPGGTSRVCLAPRAARSTVRKSP